MCYRCTSTIIGDIPLRLPIWRTVEQWDAITATLILTCAFWPTRTIMGAMSHGIVLNCYLRMRHSKGTAIMGYDILLMRVVIIGDIHYGSHLHHRYYSKATYKRTKVRQNLFES